MSSATVQDIRERPYPLEAPDSGPLGFDRDLSGAGMLHDLRNMLAVIASGARLLSEKRDRLARQSLLESVQQAAFRAERMAAGLLSRSTSKPEFRTEVGEVLRRLAPLLQSDMPEHILLAIESRFNVPPVVADPVELESAILNLVLNAKQALDGCGRITVRTKAIHRHVLIMVADDGKGMAPDVVRRVGAPFFTTKAGTGLGLGVAQVRRFALEAGGTLSVRSRPDAGTIFILALPTRQ